MRIRKWLARRKQLMKLFYFNLTHFRFKKFEDWMKFSVKMGVIKSDGTPLICTGCGGTKFIEHNKYHLDIPGSVVCEYSVECDSCKSHVGTWSYGNWCFSLLILIFI